MYEQINSEQIFIVFFLHNGFGIGVGFKILNPHNFEPLPQIPLLQLLHRVVGRAGG